MKQLQILNKVTPPFKLLFASVIINLSPYYGDCFNSFSNQQSFKNNLSFSNNDVEVSAEKVPLLLNTTDFKMLRLHGRVFVDKSEIINEYLERGGIVLAITRPPKWGKSSIIDMFKKFFEIEVDDTGNAKSEQDRENGVLFTGGIVKLNCGTVKNLKPLKISKYVSAMEHHRKNPVILISLKNINVVTYKEFKHSIRNRIKLSYSAFPFLIKYLGNKTNPLLIEKWEDSIFERIKLENIIYFLSKLLFKHFKRNVYIFIDDYDSPIVDAYLKSGAKSNQFKNIRDMTYSIIGKALKENWFLERAVLIGTFHLGWMNEILKLNDVCHSTIIDTTFSEYFGLTKHDINGIINKYPLNIHSTELKHWYNGYTFDEVTIYNPWSVLSLIANGGRFDHYWGDMLQSSRNLMDEVFLFDSAQEYLHKLLQDMVITRKEINKPINLETMEDSFHRVLLFGGFFNPVPSFCESSCYIHPWNLSIPNREVKGIIAEGVSKWAANKLNLTIEEYKNLTNILINSEIDYFTDLLSDRLSKIILPNSPTEQQHFYHQLVGGILSSLASKYKVESSRKAGQKSREYTLISLPDLGRDAIILEYEVCKTKKNMASKVDNGLRKMISNEHKCKVGHLEHIKQMIKVYMVVCKRKVVLKHRAFDVL